MFFKIQPRFQRRFLVLFCVSFFYFNFLKECIFNTLHFFLYFYRVFVNTHNKQALFFFFFQISYFLFLIYFFRWNIVLCKTMRGIHRVLRLLHERWNFNPGSLYVGEIQKNHVIDRVQVKNKRMFKKKFFDKNKLYKTARRVIST